MTTSQLPWTNGRLPPRRKYCGEHRSRQRCRPKIIQECPIPQNLFKGSIKHETMLQLDLHNPAMYQWTSMSHDWEDPLPQKKESDYLKKTDVSTAETRGIVRTSAGRNPITSNKPMPLPTPQKKQTHSMPGLPLWNRLQLPQLVVQKPLPVNKSLPASKTCQKTSIMTCLMK